MATRYISIRHRASQVVLAPRARWCASFGSRLRGLMFRRSLVPGETLVLVEGRDSRAATAIHMLFVPFPIAAVWVNAAGQVVDKALALPWRPIYSPRAPARYIVEAAPELLERVQVADELEFVAAAETAEL